MKLFTSHFKFTTLILYLLCIFLGLVLMFLNVSITQDLLTNNKLLASPIFGITMGFIISIVVLLAVIGMVLKAVRIFIYPHAIVLKNVLTTKKKTILLTDIKGFSESEIPGKWDSVPELIIYLHTRKRIEIMRMTFKNYDEIKPILLQLNVNYLGYELYKTEKIFKRKFQFD